MPLPLPKVLYDVGPGGGIVTSMGGGNALAHNMLKKKYYAPEMESQINNRNAITEGQNIANQYAPDRLQLANAFAQMRNQFYVPNIQSEINSRNALTNKTTTMTPLEAEQLRLKNEWYPKSEQASINWKNSGGSSGGVGQKELSGFQNQLSKDHPEWSPEELNQAANAYLSGDETLPDGSPLPPLGGNAGAIADQIAKRRTTAPLVTQGVKANQAEAELAVLSNYANKGLAPYGTTYFNKSPEQILDTFKSDSASQKRLGKFIASQALQFEIAQNRIKLANGQPGVTSTQELMDLSRQTINSKYPRLSAAAREEATRYMDEALREGLKARQSVKIGAFAANGSKKESPLGKYERHELDVPEGYISLYKGDKQYFFPPGLVEKKLSQGFTYE